MHSKTISFVDAQFTTNWVDNAVAQYIATNGYCYPTKTYTVTSAIANQSLANGQIDVNMELWQVNFLDWYNQVTKSGQVLDLGPTYDSSSQGWFVPEYMIKGDPARGIKASAPDLTSVSQLSKYWQLFKDPHNPQKGLFINCIAAWHCQVINQVKLKAYGLDQYFDTVTPGDEGAMKAAMEGAYQKGQPFLAYWWTPTAFAGQYHLVELKEPPYTDQCNNLENQVWNHKTSMSQVTPDFGCAYQSYPIDKGVNSGLMKTAPDFVAFLKKMDMGNGPITATAAYLKNKNVSNQQAAIWFFENYQSEWESWLPSDVAQRVKAALIADGAKLSQ